MSSRAEINADDMRKSATELEGLLNKYRNQPKYVDGKPTWSEEVQKAYDAIIKYIDRAKNGEIKKPVGDYMRSSGYFIYETPVDITYPDLAEAFANFRLDIAGWNRGSIAKRNRELHEWAKKEARKQGVIVPDDES